MLWVFSNSWHCTFSVLQLGHHRYNHFFFFFLVLLWLPSHQLHGYGINRISHLFALCRKRKATLVQFTLPCQPRQISNLERVCNQQATFNEHPLMFQRSLLLGDIHVVVACYKQSSNAISVVKTKQERRKRKKKKYSRNISNTLARHAAQVVGTGTRQRLRLCGGLPARGGLIECSKRGSRGSLSATESRSCRT